ncbi:MAG: hypothetical protein COU68_02325, partial [Candidatus Pacebacteria bacterium CG10_big_fil_rev_8_21_14_0_10_45_6]
FVALILFAIRAHSFSTNLQFDSDFGRDSLFALRILDGNLTLLGPAASVGGFYLGPLLYYFIAAIYLVFGFNPIAISISYVLMGVMVVVLGAWIQKKYISTHAAILFALLAATSVPLVTASQSATNQPMMPLVTVLFLAVYMAGLKKNSLLFDALTGIVFGLFLHIHFSAFLIFIPLVPLFFWQATGDFKRKFLHLSMFALGIFFMASPVILFDIRHDFITTRSLLGYAQATISGSTLSDARPHLSMLEKASLIGELLTPVLSLTILSFMLGFAGGLRNKKLLAAKYVQTLIVLSLGSLALAFLYKGYLFAYYLLIPTTVWLLLFASLLAQLRPRFLGILLATIISLLSFSRLTYNDKFRTVKNLSQITAVIEQDIENTQPGSFTIFKDSSDQMTGLGYEYRFLLARDGYMPHSEYEYEGADVLYYIREEGNADPLISTHWETTQFGATQAELIAEPQVHRNGIAIYRMTR